MVTEAQSLDIERQLRQQKRDVSRTPTEQTSIPANSAALDSARKLPHSSSITPGVSQRKKSSSKRILSKSVKVNPLHLATARGLQASWVAVFTGPISAGITTILGLVYLNAHLVGRLILPKVFAPFGSEWMPLKSKTLRAPSKVLGGVELITLLLIDALMLVAMATIIAFIIGINKFLEDNAVFTWLGTEILPLMGVSL